MRIYIPENDLEWIALMIENSYRHNYKGDLDNQIERLWEKYFRELEPELFE